MQKHQSSARSESGAPLLLCLFLGVLFFGAYLLLEHFSLKQLPTLPTALAFLGAYLLLSAATLLFHFIRERGRRGEQTLADSLNTKMHNLFKYEVRLPYLVCDETGRVRTVNNALQALIGARDPFYRGNLYDICGKRMEEVLSKERIEREAQEAGRMARDAISYVSEETGEGHTFEEGNRSGELIVKLPSGGRYIVHAHAVNLNGKLNYLVTFTDTSALLDLEEKVARDMPAIAYIDIDNLEELTQYTRVNYRDAARRVDDILITFAAEVKGFLREYERDRYMLIFSQDMLIKCEEDKFASLLDRVRAVRLGEYSIPVTVSIGISVSDCSMAERATEAATALDMALQRGGDQVAVRRADGIRYYGGQTRPFQRRTKVQSRVVANYLLSKISESENLLVMGHSSPDFDSIGSSIGVAQLGIFAGVPTKIIMDMNNPNFRVATERLTSLRTYSDLFVSGQKGLGLIRPGTLLILTDVNNFRIIESPEVAESVKQVSGRIAIIDHHRQTGEYDFEPVMNYIDPSASSASELVTEMLEQSENGADIGTRLVSDEVASIILSGIMLDTAGFTRNTGARTLDAARYLYSKGAQAEYVHSFFDINYEDYERDRSFSGSMRMKGGTVGLTWSMGTGNPSEDRIAAAKEAEKLLAVKGVSASFGLVLVQNAVHISGRSDGSVNVQLILERLGGGGRFDSAGAAMKDASLDAALRTLRDAIDAYFADLENARHTG